MGPRQADDKGGPVRQRIAPARSACAILVSSQNQNWEWIYSQQQTVSGGGFAGTAFSSYVPHTVRKTETRTCTECYVSKENDNNAWLASLVMQGTGLMNFHRALRLRGPSRLRGGGGLKVLDASDLKEPKAVSGGVLALPGARSIYLARTYAYVAAGARGVAIVDNEKPEQPRLDQ